MGLGLGLTDVEAAKQRVSEEELREKIEAFVASNGEPLDLFDRIASVSDGIILPSLPFTTA